MLGATVMTTLGVWDDSRGMKPVVKLAGQSLAGAALVMIAGIQVRLFDVQWLNVAITLFWVVGIANAVNFLDNMDGLAAGLASVAAGFFLVLAVLEDLSLVAALSAATMGTCLGFLYYNFQPASLFMGDAGSLLLGYVLAVLGMKLEFPGRPLASTWMIPIIVLGLPIFDMTLVTVSRLRRRVPVYKGGKDHISHRLVSRLGLSQARAVVTLYYVATGLGMLSIIVRETQPLQASLIGGGLLIAFLGILVWAERGYELEQAKPSSQKNSDTTQVS
jgi:UDP-GlcNAc:undecaprenyl-phosphate GlcNAc-1-phosphate transferase